MDMKSGKPKRGRKRQAQLELFRRGGKRKGAGRKHKGKHAGSRHGERPMIKPYHALHVAMSVVEAVGSLWLRSMYNAVRDASVVAAVNEWVRSVHLSMLLTRIHMVAYAVTEAS